MGAAAAIGLTLAGTGMKAGAAYSAGKNARTIGKFNAEINEMKAVDAIARGRETETRHRINTRRLIGSQRASFAASGVVVDDPDSTAANVFSDTAELSEIDALTIRANAAREAWGYRMQAQDDLLRGEAAYREGKQRAIGETLGGAGSLFMGGRGGGSSGGGSSGTFGIGPGA